MRDTRESMMNINFDDTEMTPVKIRETELATKVLEVLLKEYPRYDWCVEVSAQSGLCVVRIDFMGKYGFILHLDKIIYDPDMKTVKWAGGETLERYNLSRVMANQADINGLICDSRGFAIPELG